jgi:hypothetical protein
VGRQQVASGKPVTPETPISNLKSQTSDPPEQSPTAADTRSQTPDIAPAAPIEKPRVAAANSEPAVAAPAPAAAPTGGPAPSWTEGVVLALSMEQATTFDRDGKRALRDLSGSGNDAQLHGAAAAPGKVSQALGFKTAEEFLECPDTPSLNPKAVSIAVWVNGEDWTSRTAPENVIVSKQDWARRGASRGYELRIGGPQGWASFNLGGDSWKIVSVPGLRSGEWHFLTGTYDGKTQRLFVNGTERDSKELDVAIDPSPFPLNVGRGPYAKNRHFIGAIDELAVWSRALTAAEIQQLYDLSKAGRSYCAAIADARGAPSAAVADTKPSQRGLVDLLRPNRNENRRPPPSDAELQVAEAKVQEAYKSDLSGPKTPADKLAAAKKLLDQGLATRNDPAAMFVLLSRAAKLAGEAGNFDLAGDALDALGQRFVYETLAPKEAALTAAAKLAKSAPELRMLAESWRLLTEAAVARDRYEEAAKYAQQALSAARKTNDRPLVSLMTDAVKNVEAVKTAHAEASKAHTLLIEDLQDNELSNLPAAGQWGRFACLYKDDWDAGLPFWALSKSDELAPLAARDLARPAMPADQAALADDWWKAAETHSQRLPKKGLTGRAAYWYRLALPALSGLAKTQVENRLKEIDRPATSFRANEWVDVLSLVDLTQHVVEGDVARRGTEVVAGTPAQTSKSTRFYVPLTVSGAYDLEVAFSIAAGDEIQVFFPIGETNCSFVLGGWDGKTSGLNLVDGKMAHNNPTAVRHAQLAPGVRHKLLIQVQPKGKQASVSVDLDAQKVVRWQGPQSSLQLGPRQTLPRRGALGLLTIKSAAVFHTARLKVEDAGAVKFLND